MTLTISDHFADPILDDLPSREIDIDNRSNSSELTDYQVDVDVSNYIDQQGIRFVDENLQIIDYWEEDPNTMWAEIPKITGSKVSAVWLVCGDIESKSDGDATFKFFDDFENGLGKWTIETGTPSISDSEVTLKNAGISHHITFPDSFCVRAKLKYSDMQDGGRFILLEDVWDMKKTGPYIGWDNTGNICAYYSGWHDGGDYTSNVYDIVEMKNVDNTTYTFDLMVNNVLGISDAEFRSNLTVGVIGLVETDNTANFISDWVLVHKYTSPEPTAVIA